MIPFYQVNKYLLSVTYVSLHLFHLSQTSFWQDEHRSLSSFVNFDILIRF